MFGWFAPRCPLGTWEKTWTETRMCWLAEQFGLRRLTEAEVLLPTEQHFPDPYHATPADARRMMGRLCGLMRLDPGRITLKVCPDEELPGAAGSYQRPPRRTKSLIRVAYSKLADPMALVATLAHELAHELLLGGGLLDDSVPDHEWITDLLPVYLGLGVFAANSTVHEQCGQEGTLSWWVIGRQGYLPSRMFGYGMALFAWVRGETSPAWAKYLRLDAASALKQGLRYLEKTGDSVFRPETTSPRPQPLTGAEAVHRLSTGTPTVRLATLWEIEKRALTAPECLRAVTACLSDPDPTLVGEAARVLPCFAGAAGGALPALLDCLHSDSEDIRAGAAYALGELGLQKEAVAEAVAGLLRDASQAVLVVSIGALTRLGVRVEGRFTGHLMARLEEALIACDYSLVEGLAAALLATADDPERCVAGHFRRKDKELRELALEALQEQRGFTTPGREGA